MKARLLRTLRIPLYPLGFVAAFLVAEFAVWWIPVLGLVRPFVVLGVATLVAQGIATKAVGRHAGAYVAALAMMAAFDLRLLAFLLVAGVVPFVFVSLRARRFTGLDWPRLTRSLNVVAGVALALSVGGALALAAGLPSAGPRSAPVTAPPEAPDIYLVLLDGYPRADVLRDVIGYDNGPFESRLEGLGFDVAEQAHSNYNRTALSLTSILNGRPIDELLPAPPANFASQNRALSSLINDPIAVNDARRLGYSFVAIPSQFGVLWPWKADELLDSGQLTHFEYALDQHGGLRHVLPDLQVEWYRRQHRERILASLATLRSLPERPSAGPRLILAHVMLPHYPILFAADGSEVRVEECLWDSCEILGPLPEDVRDGMAGQVEYTNREIERAVRHIQETSERPAAILLFSDHGFRHWLYDGRETFRSFLATYTPGHPGLFAETASPVNLIGRVLNAYFDAGLPLADEDVWFTVGRPDGYFPLNRWTAEPP